MRFWIDLANSPHALLFAPIAADLRARGHDVVITARDAAQTLPLCEISGLDATPVGAHGGRRLAGKGARFAQRLLGLLRFARGRAVDLCVSHNAYELAVAARILGLPHLTLMDYEHQPANHLSFRLASRILVPRACDATALRRQGAGTRLRRFDGLKEEIYLEGFAPRPSFEGELEGLFSRRGLAFDPRRHVVVVLRPPPEAALYHRGASTAPFDEALRRCGGAPDARLIVLPRDAAQRRRLAPRLPPSAVIPEGALDGRELVAHADLVLSAGGTMGREAAVLGVPAYSLFTGRLGGVDRALIESGRLRRVTSAAEARAIPIEKKAHPAAPVQSRARGQVIRELVAFADRAGR